MTKLINILCRFAFIILLVPYSAKAKDHPLGVGGALGDPSGLTLKLWTTQDQAFDFLMAWNTNSSTSFYTQGSLITHKNQILKTTLPSPLKIYYGGGFVLRNHIKNSKTGTSETVLGIRAPLGISYQIPDPRFEFFGELGGALELIPSTNVVINFSLGVRYFF